MFFSFYNFYIIQLCKSYYISLKITKNHWKSRKIIENHEKKFLLKITSNYWKSIKVTKNHELIQSCEPLELNIIIMEVND